MEQFRDTFELLDMNPQPSFLVKDGIIIKANAAAGSHMIETGTPVRELLLTGEGEYEALKDGCLYLSLSVAGQSLGASVFKMRDFDVFTIEQDADNRELQAMALAAQELREPLSSIMFTADRLFPAAGLKEDPATREQVARINRGLFQMLRIISNMSDADRYSSDTPLRQEVRNICEVLEEIFSRAMPLLEHTGITLTYQGLPEAIYTRMDAEKLERAILNIISNSIKFTPKGGTIHATLTRRGNRLYLSVQDSGSGIAAQIRGNVYSRYCRKPGIEDGRFGIGLGFVLIRSAATLHGGTVLVDHPNGVGTRVTLTLAIRPGSSMVSSPVFRVDYAGERDHGLIELSDILPASAYDPERIN